MSNTSLFFWTAWGLFLGWFQKHFAQFDHPTWDWAIFCGVTIAITARHFLATHWKRLRAENAYVDLKRRARENLGINLPESQDRFEEERDDITIGHGPRIYRELEKAGRFYWELARMRESAEKDGDAVRTARAETQQHMVFEEFIRMKTAAREIGFPWILELGEYQGGPLYVERIFV